MTTPEPKPKPKQSESLFEVSDTLATDILHRIYPEVSSTIEQRIDRAKAVLYIVSRDRGKEVLRLDESPHYSAQNIAAAYRLWAQIGVPVPEVKEAGSKGSIQYLLMNHIADPPFTFDVPANIQLKVAGQMGSLLARMQHVKIDGFGRLDKNGKGTLATWSELVKSYYLHDWISERGYLTREEAEVLHRIKNNTTFPEHISVLLHGDFKPKNMFIHQGGEITIVSDPKPMAGDPLWDFAVFNHFIYREQARRNKPYDDAYFAKLRDTFRQNYESQMGRSLQDDELYHIALYEILIDAGKAESLLMGKLDEEEGESDFILGYLKRKIEQVDL